MVIVGVASSTLARIGETARAQPRFLVGHSAIQLTNPACIHRKRLGPQQLQVQMPFTNVSAHASHGSGMKLCGACMLAALAIKNRFQPMRMYTPRRPNVSKAGTAGSVRSEVNESSSSMATSGSFFDLAWYTIFHTWRTWYFATLFIFASLSAARFNPKVMVAFLFGHPGFYLTFGAISKAVYDADWKCIADGIYKMPYDADLWSMLQWMRPDRLTAYCKDARAIADRAARNGSYELPVTYRKPPTGSYPEYYLRNFHFQTDGWLSDASAATYEVSTETLFTGTQDAMQRMGLSPIHYWLANRTDAVSLELLDAGCGTGRLLCQIVHNFPCFHVTALDLSPYYLDACRSKYAELQVSCSTIGPAEFVHANMEDLPCKDASKDVVVCAYVFHELPPFARQQAVQEFWRVLRPGGLCVLLDSVQAGDLGPDMEGTLQWFPRTFHEPYYKSWLDLDLDQLFGAFGFKAYCRGQRHVSKMVAWLKPTL
mmetsp:Transcript_66383/g.130805  ORF Transcript_66383/g.130805 Transcript_66383/m.130805 type:complete len:484 (+) Transcript_66383:184-1635(+)